MVCPIMCANSSTRASPYPVTARGDGELVVRISRTPRSTVTLAAPVPSSRRRPFVIFTPAQSKADEERQRLQNRTRAGAAAAEGGEGGQEGAGAGPASNRRNEPRTGLGILSLTGGR